METPKLNIIYDSRRIEKYEPLIAELERQAISDYEIWPCIMLPSIVASINASHKMVVRDAMEKGLDEVAIAEEDVFFPAADGWKYFLRNKPKKYDLYLACTYLVTEPIKHVCGFHLYMIHSRFYERFLSIPDDVHVDTHMDELNGDYHFCYPFAALQRAGFSANNQVVCNYNVNLKEENIYGKIYNIQGN